jgi:1,4-alpha-glucan branching enzyme
VWCGRVHGAHTGQRYLYRITTAEGDVVDKADPVAAQSTEPPEIASRIAAVAHEWGDAEWMAERGARIALDAPVSIYEVHLGSWGRHLTEGTRFPNYRDLADPLADHVGAHGFTHVELLPIMEHPFYGSWGYQTLGYFTPTARHGSPADFMAMIDRLHQRGVGVILDWVPSHFPTDTHGLARFDGTHLYEHADPRQGFHPDWNSAIFNYGRNEVRSFLLSSARCWLDRYHADGLRVDAVASMLYLDYSRNEGEWIPNEYGGRENLEAIAFLRELNEMTYGTFGDTATFAEESTAWPMVSRPTSIGGLGFGYKWDMGWMHDTLEYMSREPIHRRWHHGELTFRSVYAFSENYTLPLSHDEVVHGKRSLVSRMPGDDWQKFANLRLLYGYQWTQPGKKLLFMGGELAQWQEWGHEGVLDWSLHDAPGHEGVRAWVRECNRLYRDEPALHGGDAHPAGFAWVEADDAEHSVLAYLRRAVRDGAPDPDVRPVLVVLNATPTPIEQYRVGVPCDGVWREIASSDDLRYGGSDVRNHGPLETLPVDSHGQYQSLLVRVPPLGVALFAPDDGAG